MTENYKLFTDRIKLHESHLKKEVKLSKEFGSDTSYIDDYQKKKIVDEDYESIIFISKREINEFKYSKLDDEIYHNCITGKALNIWLDFVVNKVKK